jgi:hypothetical protein
MAFVTIPLFPVMTARLTYRSPPCKDNRLMRIGLTTTRLRSDVTTNPTICATMPAPESAITSATAAPRAKKSKKNEIERSSPTKARAATTAQRIISKSKALINSVSQTEFYTNPALRRRKSYGCTTPMRRAGAAKIRCYLGYIIEERSPK